MRKLGGVRHFAAYKLPGAPDRFARNDFAALPADYRAAARMFENDYLVEEVPGGHFMHREHPDAFA